jgi:hypothetical protein
MAESCKHNCKLSMKYCVFESTSIKTENDWSYVYKETDQSPCQYAQLFSHKD